MHARQPEGVGGKPSSREVEQQASRPPSTHQQLFRDPVQHAAQQRDVAATTNNPNVTAGFTCPPEMFEPADTATNSRNACPIAAPRSAPSASSPPRPSACMPATAAAPNQLCR
uniref:Uncharacterized protein n=1 Tax=Ananas comosus var. bracteatus TaxID=296719 RepID=A0A6V7QHP3_ANACO|nr:unnamed protein product [Ananas comosus var. bracteatus]